MRFVIALTAVACLSNTAVLWAQEARGVVYDFGATWCGPCQQVAPVVEKLQREGLPIRKVDIDKQRDLTGKYNVQQIPTFVLVIDGKEVDRATGRLTEADLRRMVARIPQPAAPVTSTAPPQAIGPMSIPVELGEPAQLTRPAPMQSAPEKSRLAENDQKKGLRDLIPFGKKEARQTAEVVRGNDSSIAAASPSQAVQATEPANISHDPMDSSVRIRVITDGRIDLGSGTVITSKVGVTRILTCAHIFKEFTDDSRIEVDVFERGGTTQYTAGLVKFDATSDLGLISIPTTNVVPQVHVAGPDAAPKVGEAVAAIGCSGGEDPTRQQSRVTDIDKYEGPHNLLCVGVPVRGRSGGGLFNRQGEIIGVCSAADEQEQRGFYSGLLAIHKLLDECQLTALYMPAAKPAVAPQEQQVAAATANVERGFPADFERELPRDLPVTKAAPQEQAGSAPVDVQAGDAEVVVIIRDRSNPATANRVVILHAASPKFMSYLSGELSAGEMNMDLLGNATTSISVPNATDRIFGETIPVEKTLPLPGDAGQLRPTALSQPVIPQKYVRTVSHR